MFVEAINLIKQKIAKEGNKDGLKTLQSKIFENAVLKNQFDSYKQLKENTQKITQPLEFNAFKKALTESVSKYKKAKVKSEVNKLLEFFNINPSELKNKNAYDKAISLEETTMKKIVFNQKQLILKESFKQLLKSENELEVTKQFKIVNYFSECIADKHKKSMVKKSLRALMEEKIKNFPACVKKLYKLRTITEGIVTEAWDDEEEEKSEFGGGKTSAVKDLKYLKKISIVVPEKHLKPEKIILNFIVKFWPIGAVYVSAVDFGLKIKEKADRLERVFLNSTIYQAGRTRYFNPINTIWDSGIKRMQTKVGAENEMQFSIYLNTNAEFERENTWEDYKKVAIEMLKDFDSNLPRFMGELAPCLTPKAQQAEINATKHLSKAEKVKAAQVSGAADIRRRKKYIGGENPDESTGELPDEFAYDAF